jgi:hypothetical protein
VDADTVIARGTQHVETIADGEVVLMHVGSGRFFTLSGTGRRVWELVAEPMTIGALADRLTTEFAVDRQICIRDLVVLCEQFQKGQLIDASP